MSGVDEVGAASVEGDAQKLSGGEGATAAVEKDLAGAALFGEVFPGAVCAAGGFDEESGRERGVDVVAHDVADGQVQGVAVELWS